MDRTSGTLPNDELEQFMNALSGYQPAIPDELIKHYLSRAGFSTNDIRVERLVALAAQKFLADVSNDALAHARLRQNTTPATSKKAYTIRDTKLTLTVDDLERALRDYGVNLCKPPYFADSVSAGAPEATTTTAPSATTTAAAPNIISINQNQSNAAMAAGSANANQSSNNASKPPLHNQLQNSQQQSNHQNME